MHVHITHSPNYMCILVAPITLCAPLLATIDEDEDDMEEAVVWVRAKACDRILLSKIFISEHNVYMYMYLYTVRTGTCTCTCCVLFLYMYCCREEEEEMMDEMLVEPLVSYRRDDM